MTSDEFLSYVMPELPGCSVPLVMSHASQILLDFCQETRCWVEMLDPIKLIAGQHTCELEVPTNTRVTFVMGAHVNGRQIYPRTKAEMNRHHPGWMAHAGSAPSHFIALPNKDLRLYPTPNTSGADLTVEVALVPVPQAASVLSATLPDEVMSDHLLAISCGVKARLMAMANQTWSAPAQAAYYGEMYGQAINDAKVDQLQGGASHNHFVPPQPFGGI